MSRATVIGAGIGGLTAALALVRKGWDVEVIERAGAFRPVGVALVLAPNALRALDCVSEDLVAELRLLSAIQGVSGVRDQHGRWLTRDRPEVALERYGYPAVAVRRSVIIAMLATRLPASALRLGEEAARVDPAVGEVSLRSGEILRSDLVVAADGIHSKVRGALWPEHPGAVFLGAHAWQAVVRGEGVDVNAGVTWAREGEFGALHLVDGQVYVFGNTAAAHPRAPGSSSSAKADLQRLFGDLHAPMPELIARIDPATVVPTDVFGLREPLPAFHHQRVALLGDAAHAMAPNLGQGACQAIEDAVTLAHFVGAETDLATALAEYTAARLPRTTAIARRSEQIMRLATTRRVVTRVLRNGLLRASGLLGPSAVLRQADFVMRWDHPAVQPKPMPGTARSLTTGRSGDVGGTPL